MEKTIEEQNLKISIFKEFPYERLKEVCDAICQLGFTCKFADNGNLVFTDTKPK